MSSRDFTGAGIQRHRSGSRPISQRPSRWLSVRGSSRMCRPWRVTCCISSGATLRHRSLTLVALVELPLQVRIEFFEDVEHGVIADLDAHPCQDAADPALVLRIVKLRNRTGGEIAKKLRTTEALTD